MDQNISDTNQWRQEQESRSSSTQKDVVVEEDNGSEYSVESLAGNLADLGRSSRPTVPFETIQERSQMRTLQREIHQLRQSQAAGIARAREEAQSLRSELAAATLRAELAESRAREAEALARAQAAEARLANLSQHAQPVDSHLHASSQPRMESIKLWQLKQQLKEVKLFYFTGVQDQTSFAKWTTTIDHYAQICNLKIPEKISLATTWLGHEESTWLRTKLEAEYGIVSYPPEFWPFSWEEFKNQLRDQFLSVFADFQIWEDLRRLERPATGRGSEFNARFKELAKLTSEEWQTAGHGSRLFEIYLKKMRKPEVAALEQIAITCRRMGEHVKLTDAFLVVEDFTFASGFRSSTGTGSSSVNSGGAIPTSSTSSGTAPGPMELSAAQIRGGFRGGVRGGFQGGFRGRGRGRGYNGNQNFQQPQLQQPYQGQRALPEARRGQQGNIGGARPYTQCARCSGYGHWSGACATPQNWSEGDRVVRVPRRIAANTVDAESEFVDGEGNVLPRFVQVPEVEQSQQEHVPEQGKV